MATTIKLKNGSGAPLASDLVQGEPALDLTNKRLYTEDSGGTVIEIGTNPSSLDIGGTTVTSTGAEINLLDGSSAGTVVNSKAVIYGSSGEVKGTTFQTATNTSGNLLIGNGTAFASTAVGDLSEISSVANDDVLLAVDTSGGGLKKITRSTLVSGLATSAGISNVVEDTTPQLGGNLDMNGQDIVTTSNADLELAPNGTGHVTVKGNTNSGAIQFNCESNSHGQIVKAQPHSAGVTNELLLPAGSNSTLVSEVATQTLTNKTLTSPKINEDVAVTATATELNILDGVTATATEINLLDGVTATTTEINYLDITTLGTTQASKAVTADANGVVTFDDGVSEKYEAVTSSSNSTTVNLRTGTNFSHTLTENTTFTFSNPASSGNVSAFTLKIVQDASASGYTVTWPTSVDWPSATAPTLTATASAVDYFVFITHDGGTTYYGFTAGQALG